VARSRWDSGISYRVDHYGNSPVAAALWNSKIGRVARALWDCGIGQYLER